MDPPRLRDDERVPRDLRDALVKEEERLPEYDILTGWDRLSTAITKGPVKAEKAPRRKQRAAPRDIGRYTIYSEIGKGGMATVHYGRLTGAGGFGRTVAIKHMHPQHADDVDFVSSSSSSATERSRSRPPRAERS